MLNGIIIWRNEKFGLDLQVGTTLTICKSVKGKIKKILCNNSKIKNKQYKHEKKKL